MRAETKLFCVKSHGERGEIFVYGPIGDEFFGGFSDKEFASELRALSGAKEIDVRINSPGGDVFHGLAIYSLLASHPAKINGYIDGSADSIASVLAMACDTLEISANASMMIHEPYAIMRANRAQMRVMAGILDMHSENISQTYAARTGMDIRRIREMVAANGSDGTTMSASEAVELGFADSVAERMAVAAYAAPEVVRARTFDERKPDIDAIVGIPAPRKVIVPNIAPEETLSFENHARRQLNELKRRA